VGPLRILWPIFASSTLQCFMVRPCWSKTWLPFKSWPPKRRNTWRFSPSAFCRFGIDKRDFHKRRHSQAKAIEVCFLGQSDFYRTMNETWMHVRSNTTRGDANHRPLAFRCVLWNLRRRKIRRVRRSLWPKQRMPIRRPGLSADPIRIAFAHSALVRLEPSDPQFKRKRKIFTQTFA